MSSKACPLEVACDQADEIIRAETVIVREFECRDGSRIAHAVAWGDQKEMEDRINFPELIVIRDGMKFICQRIVLTKELHGRDY